MQLETIEESFERFSEVSMTFLYDGSFPGLFCAAFEAHGMAPSESDKNLEFKSTGAAVPGAGAALVTRTMELSFDDEFLVKTDVQKARNLWKACAEQGSTKALGTCYEAFCSDFDMIDNSVGRILCRVLEETSKPFALDNLGDDDELMVVKASGRTLNQAEKLCGLLRFSELKDGILYATISPDCDILQFLAPHFEARLPHFNFVIHDRKRAKAVLHESGAPAHIVEGIDFVATGTNSRVDTGAVDTGIDTLKSPQAAYSSQELELRQYWQRYFSAIAIQARKDPGLQANRMPKKYWADLPELS